MKSPSHPILPLLIERLERLSADSPWAHRASGLRRALLQRMESEGEGSAIPTERLIDLALTLLERAVKGEKP
ncbi:MAG: hypothetical protein WHS87_07925 [Anaerolineales bacterium]